jgi:hypothetical protein
MKEQLELKLEEKELKGSETLESRKKLSVEALLVRGGCLTNAVGYALCKRPESYRGIRCLLNQ